MLSDYDIAKAQESNRQVKIRHGFVAEAQFLPIGFISVKWFVQ